MSADAPEMVSVPTLVVVAAGDDAVLECAADANPLPSDLVTWSRQGFNFASSRVSVMAGNGSSLLTVHNITSEKRMASYG